MHLQLFWGKKGGKERETQSKKSVKERKIGWVEKKGGGGGCFVHWGYFSKQCRLEAIGRLL